MFSQVSMVPASTIQTHDIQRPTANYHPSIWKDHFLSLSTHDALKVDDVMKERAEKLKEEVRKMLVVSVTNPLEKLKLVDLIQRLGVSYHFENEIDQILKLIYMTYSTLLIKDNGEDLHTTALLFRLLRQQGYKISCDIFSKFMESNGKFEESLVVDERGILSLYEAAHMRGHGEDVLEEAIDFTTRHLKKFMEHSSPDPFVEEVSNALKWPIRKDIQRIKARQFLTIYQEDPSHNDTLLTFSKLDFNILQKLHQKELSEISRWDISMVNLLPGYMKVYYITLLDLFEEIDKEIGKDGTSYHVHFAKEAMKKQVESYFKEAEWLNKKYKPKFEEYMEVALVSSGYQLLATISYVGMGDIATKEVFDWLSGWPQIIEASTIISRLMDDVVSYKQREHVASAVECYMEKYGCSEEDACVEFQKQVVDAWKKINEACLHPTTVPMPFLLCILNLSRVMTQLYVDEDGYTNAKGRTKFLIESLLVDPVRL